MTALVKRGAGTLPTLDRVRGMLEQVRVGLSQARSIPDYLKVRSGAEAVQRLVKTIKGAEAVGCEAGEIILVANAGIGEVTRALEKVSPEEKGRRSAKNVGARPEQTKSAALAAEGISRKQAAECERLADMHKRGELTKYIAAHRKVGQVPSKAGALAFTRLAEPDRERALVKLADSADVPTAIREARRDVLRARLESVEARAAKQWSGVYDGIVIDPPWPIEQRDRDCRPNQAGVEYPTMTLDEIRALTVPCAEDCHVWLWTTHRFLPHAFEALQAWGLTYGGYTFTWVKPGGMQHPGGPQLNSEFALYARRGRPSFVDTKAFFTAFEAPRRGHSVKPDAFYDMVRRVTAGRRLDMFNRRVIEGFESWGWEAPDATTAAE